MVGPCIDLAPQDDHNSHGLLWSWAIPTSRVTWISSFHTALAQLCAQRTSQPAALEGGQPLHRVATGRRGVPPLNTEPLRLRKRKPGTLLLLLRPVLLRDTFLLWDLSTGFFLKRAFLLGLLFLAYTNFM